MRPDILVMGQGIAGTLLAWELEWAGLPFAVADPGHAAGASCAGAGIVNPVTGRRLVKSWRVDEFLPLARGAYARIASALDRPLWREMRIRRLFVDDRERGAFAQKGAGPDAGLAPFAGEGDADGFWIEGGAWVDVKTLLEASRAYWRAQGRLRESSLSATAEMERHDVVIDCTGLAGARGGLFAFVPWEFSKGELLEISVSALEPDVLMNRRHWVLPVAGERAWVGATHEPGVLDATPTTAARAALEASARLILGRDFAVIGTRAGVRVVLPDKRPVAGIHPERPGLGTVNGLGAKGVLLAPMLARQWVGYLQHGRAFDPDLAAGRFGG